MPRKTTTFAPKFMVKENRILTGHAAAAVAYIIFGFNILTCRAVAVDGTFTPVDVFTFRALGATVLFWLASGFVKKEKVERSDFPKIFAASMIGLFLCQMVFLKAVQITTPFDCAIITSFAPVFTMIVAAIAIKEPITWKKVTGVLVSLVGINILIFNTIHAGGAQTTEPLGIVLMLINGLSFAIYLGVFSPLIKKYNVITFMKWMFLFSAVVSLPFSVGHLMTVDYSAISPMVSVDLLFTIIFATFVSYFLIPVAQQRIRPTLISMYGYLQPIIAATIGICTGMDTFSILKLVSALMVFTGVWIVQRSPGRESNNCAEK